MTSANAPQNPMGQSFADRAQYYLIQGDRHAAVTCAIQAIQEDFECDSAWIVLYTLLGAGAPFPQFKAAYTLKYFPAKAAQSTGNTQPVRVKFNFKPQATDTPAYGSPRPGRASEENRDHTPPLQDEPPVFRPAHETGEKKSAHFNRVSFSSIASGVGFLAYAGYYALPTVVVGEFLITLLAILFSSDGDLGAKLIGGVVAIIGLALLIVVVPIIGQLIYILLVVMLIGSALAGGAAGFVLGILLTLVYLLTFWADSTFASIACAAAGGAACYFFGMLVNTSLVSTSIVRWPGWAIVNLIVFTLMGIAAGIAFVAAADDTSLGANLKERAAQESSSESIFKKPVRLFVKTANAVKTAADYGEMHK